VINQYKIGRQNLEVDEDTHQVGSALPHYGFSLTSVKGTTQDIEAGDS
jgi:hypothetical protein